MDYTPDASLQNMRSTSFAISEMLARTTSELRRLQIQEESALSAGFESREALSKSYDPKSMKELTAILKDIAAVEKALGETTAEQEVAAQTGVVLLPVVLDSLAE